ncbi:ATP-binding protein [Aerosakkonema funiforme]|uniref:ATP-binding protein n=1 Tax=Aerosakkonema funiforme TaxID=1246630 RepID=UPI0035B7D144
MSRKTQPESWKGYQSEQNPLSIGGKDNPRSPMRLQRTLSPPETWGFGLTAIISWVGIIPLIDAAIGPNAIFVWLPGVFMGMILNLQVRRLGEHFPDMAGGTPNYTTRLLKKYPFLGRYAASGYWLAWVASTPIYAIVMAQLIEENLKQASLTFPQKLLEIAFTILPLILTFSGTRALSIAHLFFAIPAFLLLLIFNIQGLLWLAFAPNSPGFFPDSWPQLSFIDWVKWFYFAAFTFYSCETTSSFVADSRNARETTKFLKISAYLMPVMLVGGCWVMTRLADAPNLGSDAFLNLSAAARPLWGSIATSLAIFIVAASCLLSYATVVSNCPRITYQLAIDGHISPVFGVVSRRGVFGPGLIPVLVLGLFCLFWVNLDRLVLFANVGVVSSTMLFHLGIWLNRGKPEAKWPWLSLGIFLVDAMMLIVGGLASGRQDFFLGLLVPAGILAIDSVIRRISLAPFRPAWWIRLYRKQAKSQIADFVGFQVLILILLICSAVTIGWFSGIKLSLNSPSGSNLLLVLLLCVAFAGVAIACWTSLPQVISMNESREAAEQLFNIALDAIVVLDENGIICQVNPAAEQLFGLSYTQLLGTHLHKLLPQLAADPNEWPTRSEQTLSQFDRASRILEIAISDRFSHDASQTNRDLQQYVAIVRDITDRKQAQEVLEKANEQLEIKVLERTTELSQTVDQLQREIVERQRVEANLRAMQSQIIVQEKLASLGSLTAGIAHEIRNPLNFVNNFAEVSSELVEELVAEIENNTEQLGAETSDYITEILNDLKQNLHKINHHGQRAESIVSNMLLHSRGERGHWQAMNINSLLAEYVNLAYHGMRAKDASFNITIESDYDREIGEVEVVPQDISRVFLNIINNACYATHKKKQEMGDNFSPHLLVKTKNMGERVEIRIRDNGKGIKPEVLDKIFNPFFTTKPAGEGTGLGLSISHDIVVQQHRGEMKVETEPESYAEFIIKLPKKSIKHMEVLP